MQSLEEKGLFQKVSADPHHPNFAIPGELAPEGGWGSKDEIVLGKLSPSCFGKFRFDQVFECEGHPACCPYRIDHYGKYSRECKVSNIRC